MLELFRKNMQLYVKVLMNLRLPIKYQNKVFDKGEKNELLLPDEVTNILTRNGNIRLWNGEKYVKLNLGQFYDIMQRKEYNVVDYVEPKVEVKQPEVKKEQPKVEVKQPEVKKEEEPKVEVKQPEVKKEENKNNQKNNNNKQRHNNNNNNNNKQQGGDK